MPAAPPDLFLTRDCLTGRRHVALAVSGGSDSMAMLRLAQDRIASEQPAPRLTVLTVDHGLRQGSDSEAIQVAQWSRALGLDHHTLRWSGEKPRTGLPAKARQARYDLMASWCTANGAEALLTAHTQDDQVETVLMRLARTTSPDSLAGIPRCGHWRGLPLLRPLLGAKRRALRDYLAALDQPWIEDPSNDDTRFERARIRRGMVALEEEAVARLAQLAERCASTVALLDSCATAWLRLWLEEGDAGVCHVPSGPFMALPSALQERILSRLVAHYGGGTLRPERGELQRLTRWVVKGPVRCTLCGAILGRRRTHFWITREVSRIGNGERVVPECGSMVWDRRFAISAPPGSVVTRSGDAGPALGPSVPAFARRAYPLVRVPEAGGARSTPVEIAFLRIRDS